MTHPLIQAIMVITLASWVITKALDPEVNPWAVATTVLMALVLGMILGILAGTPEV